MKSAALMLVIAAVVAASCGDEAEAVGGEGSEARAPAAATEAPAPAAAPAELEPPEETFAGESVTVTVASDGRVHVRGTDRWGRPFDSVYESGGYLARAMPALDRTFGSEDAELLRRVAGSLVEAAGDPTAGER